MQANVECLKRALSPQAEVGLHELVNKDIERRCTQLERFTNVNSTEYRQLIKKLEPHVYAKIALYAYLHMLPKGFFDDPQIVSSIKSHPELKEFWDNVKLMSGLK